MYNCVNNEFMQAVKDDCDYILRFPCDTELPHDLAIDDIPYNTLWTYVDVTNNDQQMYFRKISRHSYRFNTLL